MLQFVYDLLLLANIRLKAPSIQLRRGQRECLEELRVIIHVPALGAGVIECRVAVAALDGAIPEQHAQKARISVQEPRRPFGNLNEQQPALAFPNIPERFEDRRVKIYLLLVVIYITRYHCLVVSARPPCLVLQ